MRFYLIVLISIFLFSCNNKDSIPDVSNVQVKLNTERFEKDFFKIDTNQITFELSKLQTKYPLFLNDFMSKILGVEPAMFSTNTGNDAIKSFIKSYKPIYDSANIIFKDFTNSENEIHKTLQFIKYYFPNYKLPQSIITFIGPLDASYFTSFGIQGDVLTESAVGIGLQLHMGSQFSVYQSPDVVSIYPMYISNNFDQSNIAINCAKNIIDDLYPEKLEDKTLVQQMIEKGKRLYVLQKVLPTTDENKLIGYTLAQWKGIHEHEVQVWNLFIQNNMLQSIDKNIIKNYIGESPKTQELGDASPGNVGAFAGWQIVKKYMQKNSKISLNQLMLTDNETVFSEAKYKP